MTNRAQRIFAWFTAVVLTAALSYCLRADLSSVEYSNAETNWVDGELILTFRGDGSFTLPGMGMARILAVGGGGSGGSVVQDANYDYDDLGAPGGGGAGGLVEEELALQRGTYSIIVGKGGPAPVNRAENGHFAGTNGTDTVISLGGNELIRAVGGGGGGCLTKGNSGGSGGGGSRAYRYTRDGGAIENNIILGGAGGFGFMGGSSSRNYDRSGAGGGGAGGAGISVAANEVGGDGGAGKSSDITGATLFYAGGGGGGSISSGADAAVAKGGSGGSDVGGRGADRTGEAEQGKDGTGSGGGGGNDVYPGGKGGDGTVIVRISFVLDGPIQKPVAGSMVYTGKEIVKIPEADFAYTIEGTASAINVGEYNLKVTLKDGFYWGDDPNDKEVVDIKWSITKAPNSVTDLKMDDWRKGNAPSEPSCKVDFGDVVYTYSTSQNGEYSSVKPTDPGKYYVKAEVTETVNYNGAVATKLFEIYPPRLSPVASLGLTSEITVEGYKGTETLTNFPLLVRISEDNIKGFSYSQAHARGLDIRFADSEGNILSHEIDTWNTQGESLVWVLVPRLNARDKIMMCWGIVSDGENLKETDPTAAWKDFAGVWHLGDVQNSQNNGSGTKGASASQVDGIAAKSFQASAGNYVFLADDSRSIRDLEVENTFSVYGWVKINSLPAEEKVLFARKGKTVNTAGYSAAVKKGNAEDTATISVSVDENDSYVFENVGILPNDWNRFDIVYSKTGITLYVNGIEKGTRTSAVGDISVKHGTGRFSIGGLEGSGKLLSGTFDEFRVLRGAKSKLWIIADYEQVKQAQNFAKFDEATKDERYLLENKWLQEPEMSSRSWSEGSAAPAITSGKAAAGEVKVHFRALADAAVFSELPVKAGVYAAVFEVPSDGLYKALSKEITFEITGERPLTDLSGAENTGGMSASGRILLMNRDKIGTPEEVNFQGYANTDKTKATYWVIEEEQGYVQNNLYNLWRGSNSALCNSQGVRLWVLENCRHGNWFPRNNNNSLSPNYNYLPWSATSSRADSTYDALSIQRSSVGQLIMRNTTNAVVTSSCFKDGIGTVYFDAVNASGGDGFAVAAEICTNTVDMLPPTDENIFSVTTNRTDGGTETYVTNNFGKAVWQPLEMHPVKMTGETYAKADLCKELKLDISDHGTVSNFYRVYVPLNFRGPARIRIRRSEAKDGYGIDEVYGLVALDNIIVSYPTMRVDLEPFGVYDDAKSGKATLGWEGAFHTPYPAVKDNNIYARAKNEYSLTGAVDLKSPSDIVTSAKMHYRWRYLDQSKGPWKYVFLDHTKDDYGAFSPLELPETAGDIEFFYELKLQSPYYRYVDYSGSDKGVPGYSENIPVITNRLEEAVNFESCGEDWFVRMREGQSEYGQVDILWRADTGEENAPTNTVPMELVMNNTWRGFIQTREGFHKKILFKFAARNRIEPGAREWSANTNYWCSSRPEEVLPVTGLIADCTEEDGWTSIPCSAATGHLLFQIDHRTKALTIVRADYQNFNGWNDANRSDNKFLGSSTEDDGKVGVSSQMRVMQEEFSGWKNMPAGNDNWKEVFDARVSQQFGPYEPFVNTTTPNGWEAGPGMWAYSYFKDPKTELAFQMEGQGRGYIEMAHPAVMPRGIESLTYNARLAEFVEFRNFSYYYSTYMPGMSNYTFSARGAFDLKKNTTFSGNVSLSLIAHYMPTKGCYEFRVEQVGADTKDETKMNRKHQELSLWRWSFDKAGRIKSEKLGSCTNELDWPDTDGTNGYFVPMFVSVSNAQYEVSGVTNDAVVIMAGIMRGRYGATQLGGLSSSGEVGKLGIGSAANVRVEDGRTFSTLKYIDASAGKLTKGTYGLLTANSEGMFLKPVCYGAPVSNAWVSVTGTSVNKFESADKQTFFPSDYVKCDDDIENDMWAITPGRMTPVIIRNAQGTVVNWGFGSLPPYQELRIYTVSPYTNDGWKLSDTRVFTNFVATAGEKGVHNFYKTEDAYVRIAVGGNSEDRRTDVVIDNIELRQWRGDVWANVQSYVPNWTAESNYRGHTNFVFNSGWIKNGSVLLSAKRTQPGTPCSIRSPLFDGAAEDGTFDRGIGLGMFSFSYANAQTNVNLLLQIATNITYNSIGNINNFDGAIWHTVTNYSFKGLSKAELSKGSRSHYIGLHGVKGVMRLVMDPKVVSDVHNSATTNTTAFGEIQITGVLCRDEPYLDSSSWWGWNLRTLGVDGNGDDDEKKMFLPDLNNSFSQGMSLALNNSTTKDVLVVKTADGATDEMIYRRHIPFLQTPTFATNIVGEVSFKARKYDNDSSQPAQVTIYGSRTGADDVKWDLLGHFIVTNEFYSTYTYKTTSTENYNAFRLAVTGVANVTDPNMSNRAPESYDNPVRVLIDEVVVSEAVRVRMAFRNVGTFRSLAEDVPNIMNTTAAVPGVPSAGRQPLAGENWGVQCEIYPAQLAEEIDLVRVPRVRLRYFPHNSPWGYENWKNDSRAKTAYLGRATETNLVYRSSFVTAPDAVLSASPASGSVVQYMLEVEYYQKGKTEPMTNMLSSAEWVKPEWYRGIDYNRLYGGANGSFAAYNILDTVAPGWAWINEVNIFGGYDADYANRDADRQYIEIAVPAEADISGWYVNLLVAHMSTDKIITNRIATFGANSLSGTKKDLLNMASNMVFRVIASPNTASAHTLDAAAGEIDGAWSRPAEPSTEFNASGEIYFLNPIGIQLVRGSHIIEHEVVAIGTNYYNNPLMPDTLRENNNPEKVAKFFNKMMPESRFFVAGEDSAATTTSVGVFDLKGENGNVWTNGYIRTPGFINHNQAINPVHPTPNGESLLVYANLSSFGHLVQTVGEHVRTNANVILVVPKGLRGGTNITYHVDKWYDLGSVTTNKVPAAADKLGPYVYQLNVADNASNNVTVEASAKISDRLVDLGIADRNAYTPAVMKWLADGVRLDPRSGKAVPWTNRDSDDIHLADVINANDQVLTNLSLTAMYWLDMDPTVPDQALKAYTAGFDASQNNPRIAVHMSITNRTSGTAYTPYVLRGLEPGSLSWDYSEASPWGWTSVTFKVTGILNNGAVDASDFSKDWIPLRWFVFRPDSFRPLDDPQYPGVSFIDIHDPHSTESPGYWSGWYNYPDADSFLFKFTIDTRLKPYTVELLKRDNKL